jgi:hypothetical protein
MSSSNTKATKARSTSLLSKLPRGIDGVLLLSLIGYISVKFDPSGVPCQRLSEITLTMIAGTMLWASFHLLVSFLLSPMLSRKLPSLYSDVHGSSSQSVRDRHCEFLNRVVSLVHAVLSFSFALLVLSTGFEIGHRNTELQSKMLTFSATYFLFDYFYVTFHRLGDSMDVIHHFISVGGLMSTLLLDQCGGEVVCAVVVTEVSNPFLHIRKLLQILKLHKLYTIIFQYNNYMFVLAYLVGRMLFGGWFVYLTISSANSPQLMKVPRPALRHMICSVHLFQSIAGCVVLNAVPVCHMVQAHSRRRPRPPRQQGCPTVARSEHSILCLPRSRLLRVWVRVCVCS